MMDNYLLLGHRLLKEGRRRGDRTGTGTRSVRSANLVFDMQKGFPLVTTKKVNLEYVFHELKWILLGLSDVQFLEERGCGFIWRDWSLSEPVIEEVLYANWQRLELLQKEFPDAYAIWKAEGWDKKPLAEGHGFMTAQGVPTHWQRVKIPAGETNAPYGPRWRNWKGRDGKTYDQIAYVLDLLRTNPESRRILISTWDPADMPDESISPQANIQQGKPCLTPCHHLVEFYTDLMTVEERVSWLAERNPLLWDKWVNNDEVDAEGALLAFLDKHSVPERYLDLKFTMRSSDVAIGLPYNIASYGMLLMMFATTLNMVPRELEYSGTNVHLYENHIAGFTQQFSRAPRTLPQLEVVNKRERLEDYEWEDFCLTGYQPHPFIKYDVSV